MIEFIDNLIANQTLADLVKATLLLMTVSGIISVFLPWYDRR